ncbi:D-alanyl-D-alanine carboxypeptidase/D-alanyl-D-alanine-endopeptidase [Antrihabitans spumae]|uniref:D-alanyl-D-alanine carboxypeptidase/D-alanyl-D-alanine-endopeptidase n=1 Tax=Antrihabitans spumae TaxID=3373370 RepID=A0ABW7KBP5_9NOCA
MPGSGSVKVGAVVATVLVLASACSSSDNGSSDDSVAPAGSSAEIGTLPDAAKKVMEKPEYGTARWIYYVSNADTGEVLLANRPDEMIYTGSTAKNFTVASVYDTVGADTRFTTPVYTTAPPDAGVVPGNLVLVASGDLALGGRGGLDGKMDHTFYSDTVDHQYGNLAPNARPSTDVGDPLAGVTELARQVAAKGVTRIDGDVVIDTRLWDTYQSNDGPVTPIFVNDNILDVMVTAAAVDGTATIVSSPQTGAYTVVSQVQTVAGDGDTALSIEPDPADPTKLLVSGTIAAGKSQLSVYNVPDPADWARILFIEALGRAGVTVAAPARAANNESILPASGTFTDDRTVASIESPPVAAMGAMILETSYNAGANAFLCMLAVKAGKTDCLAGIETIYGLVEKAGLNKDAVFVTDGQGGDPASATPRQLTKWMEWARKQPWGDAIVAGQPVLAESGSLAPYGAGTPAAGKVAAKAGTGVALNPSTGRLLTNVQSLAGYLTLDDGTVLAFDLAMGGATYPQLYDGLVQAGADVAEVAAAFQQGLSN